MRLLNVKTLRLEEFFGDDVPPYAILSHTWGNANEEVSYQDISTSINWSRMKNQAGYQKIQYLCNQAEEDGLLWAWCDTCCINKDSSSELSESINSMFRWYENAEVCYAYLSDVPANGTDTGVERFNRFRESRWFCRGWTLQELLAPENLNFYIQGWTYFGTKKDLAHLIREITQIQLAALISPWTIPSYCIAIRMKWASRRNTTRLEDRAYCMLGILEVHIPLLYGEGENAFRRLQEELVRTSDDESLFVHTGDSFLAKGPEAFDQSLSPVAVQSAVPSHPYTMTNKGLNIRLRLLEFGEGSYRETYGILNCSNGVEYMYYIAMPLLATGIPETYIKVGGFLRFVDEDEAIGATYHTIFIRQHIQQTYLIECFLETSRLCGYSACDYYASSRTTKIREKYHIHINPKSTPKVHEIHYNFHGTSCGYSFTVKVAFNPVFATAGVWIMPSSTTVFNADDVSEGQNWPTLAELQIQKLEQAEILRAAIKREKKLSREVWVLKVWNDGRDSPDGYIEVEPQPDNVNELSRVIIE
jgi:Heterokaryon incompatibility protein (HET)